MPPVMTTKDSFPAINITHRPKRMQGDNILKSMQADGEDTPSTESTVKFPQIVTLERAIEFYESNAEGENAVLYTQTAKWLRELMTKSVTATAGVDIDKAQELLKAVRGRG